MQTILGRAGGLLLAFGLLLGGAAPPAQAQGQASRLKPDGRMLNEELAREGFATALVYPLNVRYVERIRRAVADAQSAKRGLWATDGFACQPREHRRGKC